MRFKIARNSSSSALGSGPKLAQMRSTAAAPPRARTVASRTRSSARRSGSV
jgi:hypothetical protein